MAPTMSPKKPYWVFSDNEEEMPCRCCSPTQAMDDGAWHCHNDNMTTYTRDSELDVSQPHDSNICPGGCQFHPLVDNNFILLNTGKNWGDVVYEEEMQRLATMSASERIALQKERDVEAAKAAAEVQHYEMKFYQEKQELRVMGGMKIVKKDTPCKDLYYDESVPKSQWVKNKRGKLCAPEVKYVCSQCWLWEYDDPRSSFLVDSVKGVWLPEALKTGLPDKVKMGKARVVKRSHKDGSVEFVVQQTPRTCAWLHPGEPAWQKEWQMDKYHKTATQMADPKQRFSALLGRR